MKQIQFATFLVIAVFVCTDCKKDNANTNPDAPPPSTPTSQNKPPVAKAGADTSVNYDLQTNSAEPITLNGKASFDPDGKIVSQLWTGPAFIVAKDSAITQVTNLVQGTHQYILSVTDDKGAIGKDTVIVNVVSLMNRPVTDARLVHFGKLSQARSELSVGTAGNKLVFAGGYTNTFSSAVDIYDFSTALWSTKELTVPRSRLAVASVGNKILFTSGMEQGIWDYDAIHSNVDVYDAAANAWSIAHLNMARDMLAAAAIGSKAYFAGGTYFNILPDYMDIYDEPTNTWTKSTTGTLSGARSRSNLSAVTVGNSIYFAGGHQYPYHPSDHIDIYDAVTSTWSMGNLSEPKDGHAAIAVNNKIFWAGGTTRGTDNSFYLSSLVEIKDVTTQTSTFAHLSQPNANFAAVANDNKIVFFTGSGASTNQFDIYDLATNTWSIGRLSQNIRDAAIITFNNKIYVAGGYVNGVFSNDVWILEF